MIYRLRSLLLISHKGENSNNIARQNTRQNPNQNVNRIYIYTVIYIYIYIYIATINRQAAIYEIISLEFKRKLWPVFHSKCWAVFWEKLL